jgi:hypothetical protein
MKGMGEEREEGRKEQNRNILEYLERSQALSLPLLTKIQSCMNYCP